MSQEDCPPSSSFLSGCSNVLKMHPSFPLSFPFPPSHGGGGTQSREVTSRRCAGQFFSSATDLQHIGVDSHFKDGSRERKGKKESFFF